MAAASQAYRCVGCLTHSYPQWYPVRRPSSAAQTGEILKRMPFPSTLEPSQIDLSSPLFSYSIHFLPYTPSRSSEFETKPDYSSEFSPTLDFKSSSTQKSHHHGLLQATTLSKRASTSSRIPPTSKYPHTIRSTRRQIRVQMSPVGEQSSLANTGWNITLGGGTSSEKQSKVICMRLTLDNTTKKLSRPFEPPFTPKRRGYHAVPIVIQSLIFWCWFSSRGPGFPQREDVRQIGRVRPRCESNDGARGGTS